ncbi:Start control protein cdc10 [Cytospora mali]|uniref:Transcription factor SWI6 n=1 Tax=Cytospora mali TaxID=578113 RepID=A0A194VC69_CYTMA|nr:Start control protein cdc10 [Valsa mali var. pyri (nom. inval.)]
MASATLTKPPPPPPSQQSTQPIDSQSQSNHRLSFSSSQGPVADLNQGAQSTRHPLPTTSGPVNPRASFDHSNTFASMSQPQPQPQFSSQHSFSMSQPSSQPGRPTGYHQFANSQPSNMEDEDLPQIYSSVYSGVEVYEMEVNGVAVMRRRDDSCLNATQILKVAGLDKGKRTKILEKEIQTGEHEKVQGGYGKYQGTWISFDRGVQVCRQYGVEDVLRPLLTYDMGEDGALPGRGDINTPTKEQAMAAQRKRLYSQPMNNRSNSVSGTFFKNISSTASNAVAAISKARLDSPGPRARSGLSRAPSFNRQASMQSMDDFPGNSQQSYTSEHGRNADSAYSTQRTTQQVGIDGIEPPRKRLRVAVTPADSFGPPRSQSMYMNAENFPGSPTEPNESFIYSQRGIDLHAPEDHDGISPLPPLPHDESIDAEVNRKTLLSFFTEPAEPNAFEELRSLTPRELDMPIDSQQHTALHWAATLSRMNIVQALIKHGANPFRVNSEGQTALMRAVIVTNSHDNFSFPELLDLLGHTLEVADNKGRTVLHHIVVTSAIERRHATSKYYLDCLLEWVVRQGSAPSSQDHGVNGNVSSPGNQPKIGLGRFMTEVVNAQDKVGDTALNLAARISNRSIISQLLEVHADPSIPNRVGLRPVDFGIGEVPEGHQKVEDAEKTDAIATQRSQESSDDIMASMKDLLGETAAIAQEELSKKQETLEELQTALRANSSKLAETRRNVEAVKEKLRQQQINRQQVANLSRELERLQYSMGHIDNVQASAQSNSAAAWEDELETAIKLGKPASALPDATLLRARLKATTEVVSSMKDKVAALQGSSRDIELKYRRLVSLAANCPEEHVDDLLQSLVRAVQSEKGELEIGRVRKFLGGVEVNSV